MEMKTTNYTIRIAAMGLGLATAITIIVSLNGCTKVRPYKSLLKDEVYAKSIIDTTADYMYAPSITNSPRSSSSTMPNWLGDSKLVRFRFTEKGLDILEKEKDPRFAANPTNDKPVISIPVDHIEYRCKLNSVNECSNEEEENKDITWDQRTQFKPDFTKTSIQEVNMIPIEIDDFFKDCHKELGTEMISAKLENDAVNFEIEKTYRANPDCLDSDMESLSDVVFAVRFHYSFVKMDKLTTPDYEIVQYPQSDENTFGFFVTENNDLSVDNNKDVEGQRLYLNRWNQKRKSVDYYLSDEFLKPEYAGVKQASYDSVNAINDAFQQAGVDFKVNLKEPAGKQPGDIRTNMIILVEDPQATGIIGYGPTVANPNTGEILNGRVIMYLGSIKKYIKYTYQEIIDERTRMGAAHNQASQPSTTPAPSASPAPDNITPSNSSSKSKVAGLSSEVLQKIHEQLSNITSLRSDLRNETPTRASVLAKYAYPAELFNFTDVVGEGLIRNFNFQTLKPWTDLTDAEKNQVIEVILPYIWIPTLVHELGHNMGLRHNFAGSEDKDNFYTKEEWSKDGISERPQYSSVMDYPYRELNNIRKMGKYDIAALRFGYKREVETAPSGGISSVTHVDTTLADLKKNSVKLKEYKYCTDEHVGINANCRRFDEGTTYTEIAQHYVAAYEASYSKYNFRNHRKNFSLMDDTKYADRTNEAMLNLRIFFEVYENIQNKFQPSEDDWKSIAFLADLKSAMLISRDFFIKVLTTPDAICIIANASQPDTVTKAIPLTILEQQAGMTFQSCFDPALKMKAGIKIIGQTGKRFKSVKLSSSDNPYADQIDIHGIWIDKLLAERYLFKRTVGSSLFDVNTGNYIDFTPDGAKIVAQLVDSFLSDSFSGSLDVTLNDGSIGGLKTAYSLFDFETIERPLSRAVEKRLNLPASKVPFVEVLMWDLMTKMPDVITNDTSRGMIDRYSVSTAIPNGRDPKEYLSLDIGLKRYYTLPQNSYVADMFKAVRQVRLLNSLGKDKVTNLLQLALQASTAASNSSGLAAATNPSSSPAPAPSASPAPVVLTDAEQTALGFGAEVLAQFVTGNMNDEQYDTTIIEILARVYR